MPSAGFNVLSRTKLIGQFYAIKSIQNGTPLTPNDNPNAQSDYDLYKSEISLSFKFIPDPPTSGWDRRLFRPQYRMATPSPNRTIGSF